MSFAELRELVTTRNTVADRIASSFLPLERGAHELAVDAAQCHVVLLTAQHETRLGTAGMDVIKLISDVARDASVVREKLGMIHERLRELSVTHNIPLAADVDCPPNEGIGLIKLPFFGG